MQTINVLQNFCYHKRLGEHRSIIVTCYFHPPLSSKKFEINTESWAIDRQTLQLNLAIFLQARLNVG